MTDLTYCHSHMSEHDLRVLDTLDTFDYLDAEFLDDEIDIPFHLLPPNPDDNDVLPSQVHPSYPFGNPTSAKHQTVRTHFPRYAPIRALFVDSGFGDGVTGPLRWKDLALSYLLPVDHVKEDALKSEQARNLTSGAIQQQQGQNQSDPAQANSTYTDDEDEDEDEDEYEDEDDADADDFDNNPSSEEEQMFF